MHLGFTLGLFAPDPNQGPEYPQPQSSQLAFMARLLVSADLSTDRTSATGGCPCFVPGPAYVVGNINGLRQPRWGYGKFEGFWPKKAGKIPGEK